MLKVAVENDEVRIGKRFAVSFQRTLRIPDDGKTYPLPPSLGRFPIRMVKDYAGRVPVEWRAHGGVFIPMYQREALWLGFDGASWKPNAVQIAAGGVNAVSGQDWEEGLSSKPQNYIVCPDQPWLDGINAGDGSIRQFVANRLGEGYTIEAQLTGEESLGGLQIRVYEPEPGRFPDRPPSRAGIAGARPMMALGMAKGGMGLGVGGKMRQMIYPDRYGLDSWDLENYGSVFVHIINSEQYREITGHAPPPTPVSAKIYTEHGFPWFDLYDERKGTVKASERLSKVKSVREKDAEKGIETKEESAKIKPGQVEKIKLPKSRKR
jgi:hypothetical protein